MKIFFYLIYLVTCLNALKADVIFQGLTETNISKNNFLCPSSTSSGVSCVSADANAINFTLPSGQILQLFNALPYWLDQEAITQQYDMQVLNYTQSEIQTELNSTGWGAMGGYCLLITTNPILTSIVMPSVVAASGQEKVVVQLWYNGDQSLQLWSQNALAITQGSGFTIAINSATDPLSELTSTTPSNSLRATFLSGLQLQPNNRNASTYSIATNSPRSVTIVPSA